MAGMSLAGSTKMALLLERTLTCIAPPHCGADHAMPHLEPLPAKNVLAVSQQQVGNDAVCESSNM